MRWGNSQDLKRILKSNLNFTGGEFIKVKTGVVWDLAVLDNCIAAAFCTGWRRARAVWLVQGTGVKGLHASVFIFTDVYIAGGMLSNRWIVQMSQHKEDFSGNISASHLITASLSPVRKSFLRSGKSAFWSVLTPPRLPVSIPFLCSAPTVYIGRL